MTTIRYIPAHTPFFKRQRPYKQYIPKKIPRFIREHTNCGEVIPYSRWWLNRPYSSFRKRYPNVSLYRWLIRTKIIRPFKPGLVPVETYGVQPMNLTNAIFSIRAKYE